jgi:hypothetical protein
MSTTELLELLEPEAETKAETKLGPPAKMSHIVVEGFWPTDAKGCRTGEFVSLDNCGVDAIVFGTPVRALCGLVWVPTEMTKYPVCPACIEAARASGWAVPG